MLYFGLHGIEPEFALPLPPEARQLLSGGIADMMPAEIVDSGDVQVLRALRLLDAWPAPGEGAPGDKISLQLRRGGRQLDVKVAPAARPAAAP